MTTSGSEIYAAYIEAELKAETDRRDSVNTRAASAVTSATALITLALAVFGLLVGKGHSFPECAQPFLILALILLPGSGACAVAAGFPWRQRFVKATTLEKMLNARRADPEENARYTVAYCNMVELVSLRSGTTIKTWFLLTSGICQIMALAALGACVWSLAPDQPEPDEAVVTDAQSAWGGDYTPPPDPPGAAAGTGLPSSITQFSWNTVPVIELPAMIS